MTDKRKWPPIVYRLRVKQLQLFRSAANCADRKTFAVKRNEAALPHTLYKHQSLLRRRLGDSDPQLQENKIVNLKLAIAKVDGLTIEPGETFSFWRLVGKPSREKGYVDGMLLSQGKVLSGPGGGLCQLANLLYWMALHTPLTVTERHHHSFDPFPDDRRVLPFGSGASVFYNYIDLRFVNPTKHAFQIRLQVTDKHLKGVIAADRPWPFAYHLVEREHRFLKKDSDVYRENELWRVIVDSRTGLKVSEERIIRNFSRVAYPVDDELIEAVVP